MSSTARISAVFCLALASACDVSGVVGSRWLTTGNITAAGGGTIAIAAAQSQSLAGAQLNLPPHVLAQSALIGVGPGISLEGGDWIAAGPAVDWDPDDTALVASAGFALPAHVPAGRSPAELLVITNNAAHPLLTGAFDADEGVLHFQADHLGNFQAVVGKACSGRDGCAQGDSCVHGFCRPGDDPHHN